MKKKRKKNKQRELDEERERESRIKTSLSSFFFFHPRTGVRFRFGASLPRAAGVSCAARMHVWLLSSYASRAGERRKRKM